MTEINPESQLVNNTTNSVDGFNNRSVQGNESSSVLGDKNNAAQGRLTAAGDLNIKSSLIGNVIIIGERADNSLSIVKVETKTTKKGYKKIKIDIDFSTVDNTKIQRIELLFQEKTGDLDLKITDVKKGCVEINIEASPKSIELLQSLIESGELTAELAEILGISIEDVRFFNEDISNANNSSVLVEKSSPQEIVMSGIELFRSFMSEADLSELEPSGIELSEADLVQANLLEVDLSQAFLFRSFLSGANLSGANLVHADLVRANLIRADLSESDLREANLSEANLVRANLSGANLSNANLSGANLSNVNLSGANLVRANLIRADLSEADLSRSDLREANLSNVNLSRAFLIGANLNKADLNRANLSEADLSRAIVKDAIFTNAIGLLEIDRADLERRGAIFGDRPPSPVLVS